MDLESRRRLRTALAKFFFDETDGMRDKLANPAKFVVPDGWSGDVPTQDDVKDAVKWLEGQGLVKAHWTYGGVSSVQLTHHGVVEMERAISAPARETEHFVPLVNITTIGGSVYGSQLQQGSPGASQTGTFTLDQRNDVEAFIVAARALLDRVDDEVRTRVAADLEMMERELKDGKPRAGILQAIGREVRAALISAGGSAAIQALSAIQWP